MTGGIRSVSYTPTTEKGRPVRTPLLPTFEQTAYMSPRPFHFAKTGRI